MLFVFQLRLNPRISVLVLVIAMTQRDIFTPGILYLNGELGVLLEHGLPRIVLRLFVAQERMKTDATRALLVTG